MWIDTKELKCVSTRLLHTSTMAIKCAFMFIQMDGGDGKGTHISIFTFLMRGSYDDHLKWPFRGNITIQIVNQAGDHDHIEMIIHYNDETPD